METNRDNILHQNIELNYIQYNQEVAPKVSLILLDWNCRESFHLLKYLDHQTVSRDQYEIIWIEYYQRKPEELRKMAFETLGVHGGPLLDQWLVLNMTEDIYYHKHLMYNIGIVASHGEIVVIMDSDAFVAPTFIQAIIDFFAQHDNVVLHLDEVRNVSRRNYPFNYPAVAEVLSKDCINWKDGKTTGLWDTTDILHTRNYGACFCARRSDVIAVGGADEHLDYLGHICGPYDLTFRLKNYGLKEVWHQSEFLYHVWHPGTDGVDNYLGPHDGRNLSTTSLAAFFSRRILPWVENQAINLLRTQTCSGVKDDYLLNVAIDLTRVADWSIEEKKQTVSKAREKWHKAERKEAFRYWEYAIITWPDDLTILEEAMEVFRVGGSENRAFEIVEQILQIDSKRPLPLATKAHIMLAKNEYRRAYELFQTAIEEFMRNLADDPRYYAAYRNALIGMGGCFIRLGNYSEAAKSFTYAQKLTRPDETAVLFDLAKGKQIALGKSGLYRELFCELRASKSWALLALIRNAIWRKTKQIIKKIIWWEKLKPIIRGHQ